MTLAVKVALNPNTTNQQKQCNTLPLSANNDLSESAYHQASRFMQSRVPYAGLSQEPAYTATPVRKRPNLSLRSKAASTHLPKTSKSARPNVSATVASSSNETDMMINRTVSVLDYTSFLTKLVQLPAIENRYQQVRLYFLQVIRSSQHLHLW